MKLDRIKSWLEGKFAIYNGQQEQSTYPRRKWRIGKNFLPRLYGVNYSVGKDGLEVNPVYIPLWKYEHHGEIVTFDVHFWTLHPWSFYLMKFPPYIHLMPHGVVSWTESEDE